MSVQKLPPIQSPLLKWFRENRRDLPWRQTSGPYAIWISEVMLQQTQVKTVIPYYNRWMKNFPTSAKLARAPLSRVLKSWEGLGYYTRARNLHRAARMIERDLGGKFPDSREKLERLPGVGRYTAGAIASIAFHQPEPILDGNVIRVLSRLLAFNQPVDQTGGREALWGISRGLVESAARGRAGDFNQALMELGALVCVPENPQCFLCPVQKICRAHQLKKETDFPVKTRRQKLEKLRTVAAVIWKDGKVLLEKRPLEARWGGLWTFPHWTLQNGKRELTFLAERTKKELGLEVGDWRARPEIRHGFTKYNVRLKVYEGSVLGRGCRGGINPAQRRDKLRPYVRWVQSQNISRLPLPRPHQKIAALIQNHA